MHPQLLRTWPRGRHALAIRAHNLFQNNGKRNLFSQNWSDNDAKMNRLKEFYDIFLFARVGDKMTKTGTADLMKGASKSIFRTRRVRNASRRQVLD